MVLRGESMNGTNGNGVEFSDTKEDDEETEPEVVDKIEEGQAQGAPSKKIKLIYPECPICFKNMTHETRIMQCYSGHSMC